jgi:hypothetical protein
MQKKLDAIQLGPVIKLAPKLIFMQYRDPRLDEREVCSDYRVQQVARRKRGLPQLAWKPRIKVSIDISSSSLARL